jgi:hypothetical protein
MFLRNDNGTATVYLGKLYQMAALPLQIEIPLRVGGC